MTDTHKSTFHELAEVPPTRIWDGVLARMIHSELITMAIVELGPDTPVPLHQHHNEQLGFVITGSVRFTVDGETRTLGPGGNWRIFADVPHQAESGPGGAVVAEVYSPVRQDWVGLPTAAPSPPGWPAPADQG